MKIKEAKDIIGVCLEWQFWMMGIRENRPTKTLNPVTTTLSILIESNKTIERHNEKQRKKYSGTGETFSQHQTLDDRVIAAIYTALSYTPDGEAKAVINGIGVGVVKIKY
ncbi:hypothetical protein [Joostella sp.]|uniref:hypothetical protein n=1 Tax=Joostella sp. TaxID=2231138 RepID=UPI003A90CD3E